MSMMLNTYLTRSPAHGGGGGDCGDGVGRGRPAIAVGGRGRPAAGRFDTTRRHQTEHDFRSDVALAGGQAEDVLPFSTACTYEIPPEEAPPFRLVRGRLAARRLVRGGERRRRRRRWRRRVGPAERRRARRRGRRRLRRHVRGGAGERRRVRADAEDVDPRRGCPRHVLYPLTADSFFRAQFIGHRHKAWNLPRSSGRCRRCGTRPTAGSSYRVCGRERLVRRMMGDVADLAGACPSLKCRAAPDADEADDHDGR